MVRHMGTRLPIPPPGFDDLPVEEQIEYVHSLWSRITAKPDQVPVPDWHRGVLRERLAVDETGGERTTSWEQVRGEIRSRIDRSRSR